MNFLQKPKEKPLQNLKKEIKEKKERKLINEKFCLKKMDEEEEKENNILTEKEKSINQIIKEDLYDIEKCASDIDSLNSFLSNEKINIPKKAIYTKNLANFSFFDTEEKNRYGIEFSDEDSMYSSASIEEEKSFEYIQKICLEDSSEIKIEKKLETNNLKKKFNELINVNFFCKMPLIKNMKGFFKLIEIENHDDIFFNLLFKISLNPLNFFNLLHKLFLDFVENSKVFGMKFSKLPFSGLF